MVRLFTLHLPFVCAPNLVPGQQEGVGRNPPPILGSRAHGSVQRSYVLIAGARPHPNLAGGTQGAHFSTLTLELIGLMFFIGKK